MADSTNKLVAVGPNASQFHCMITGITITKGYPVTLTPAQYKSKRIKQALNSGHLQILQVEENEVSDDIEVAPLLTKLKGLISVGKTAENISKSFSLIQLKAIAKELNYETTDEDTRLTLVEALLVDEEIKGK